MNIPSLAMALPSQHVGLADRTVPSTRPARDGVTGTGSDSPAGRHKVDGATDNQRPKETLK